MTPQERSAPRGPAAPSRTETDPTGSRWRRAGPRDRRTARSLWLLATLTAAGTAAVILAAPALPACVLRETTGWPCLTCGAGRGWRALADGQVAAGMGWNPLFTAGLMLAVAAGWAAPLWVAVGAPVPAQPPRPRAVLLGVLTLCAAQWIYALVRGAGG